MQQFIKHVLFDIYWQNMKFNIQKYIGDVLSGGDGWPISHPSPERLPPRFHKLPPSIKHENLIEKKTQNHYHQKWTKFIENKNTVSGWIIFFTTEETD